MTNADIFAWLASHSLLLYPALALLCGAYAYALRKRPDAEWLAYKLRHPRAAYAIEFAREAFPSPASLLRAVVGIALGHAAPELAKMFASDGPRVSSSRPPPIAPETHDETKPL